LSKNPINTHAVDTHDRSLIPAANGGVFIAGRLKGDRSLFGKRAILLSFALPHDVPGVHQVQKIKPVPLTSGAVLVIAVLVAVGIGF
jgi:hypothetical protein